MCNNEGYLSKRTSQACTAEHLWGLRFALFTTVWGHSSSTWCTTKIWPMEALELYKDICYWQHGIFKAFWGHSDLRWLQTLPGQFQVQAGKFKIFLMGKGLKEMSVWWGLPPSVQYGHSEPVKASDPHLPFYFPFKRGLTTHPVIHSRAAISRRWCIPLKMEGKVCFCKAAKNWQWNHLQHGKILWQGICEILPQITLGLVTKNGSKNYHVEM